jgi:AcrR family transcriptional regulator
MTEKPASPEERIILATIDCIEKYGLSGATNRQIAETAGVNIAAINYYFRSKDVLMEQVMEITLSNAFDLSDLDPMPGASAQERLMAVLLHLIQGGLRYPNLTRAHFHRMLVEGQDDPLPVKHINCFIDALACDLQTRGCRMNPDDLRTALVQSVSAVLLVALAPNLFQQPGLNLVDESIAQAYAARLANNLLAC